MGQYFTWLNVDKREQLDPLAFEGGLKWCETCYVGSERTEAALTLLAGPWAGDAVIFMGDYCSPGDIDNPLMQRVAAEYGAHGACDLMEDTFTNVTGMFAVVRGRGECLYENDVPLGAREYVGTFDVAFSHPRYLINDSKREYVDREQTMVWHVNRGHLPFGVVRFDPTPLLLSSGHGPDGFEEFGPWLGDRVHATNARPEGTYADMSRAYVCTFDDDEVPVFSSDCQIRAVMERRTGDFDGLSDEEIESIKALLRRC